MGLLDDNPMLERKRPMGDFRWDMPMPSSRHTATAGAGSAAAAAAAGPTRGSSLMSSMSLAPPVMHQQQPQPAQSTALVPYVPPQNIFRPLAVQEYQQLAGMKALMKPDHPAYWVIARRMAQLEREYGL